ncbi:hypothetical protein BCR41DRAFT_347181 [Lobosporangium transversale]|uniref:Uncharacterized protein n=1 Tax=Lobosporangium transversale TaxID=64571 RepID=A0A1Y2GXI5_9FUNG|nr:hypothetical protein BCR41DRAFT_347181 [Lobosporangium transversale]ORZ26987.1 hypothetical protein BCR41DRAFT_347181 [Lobosporangium transversale]|eukprot:XP_021884734.1 hypothetical protein BCR41DRAFT_347181 [Lobosporangium transversale]
MWNEHAIITHPPNKHTHTKKRVCSKIVVDGYIIHVLQMIVCIAYSIALQAPLFSWFSPSNDMSHHSSLSFSLSLFSFSFSLLLSLHTCMIKTFIYSIQSTDRKNIAFSMNMFMLNVEPFFIFYFFYFSLQINNWYVLS